jgi:hypothetical protein
MQKVALLGTDCAVERPSERRNSEAKQSPD